MWNDSHWCSPNTSSLYSFVSNLGHLMRSDQWVVRRNEVTLTGQSILLSGLPESLSFCHGKRPC